VRLDTVADIIRDTDYRNNRGQAMNENQAKGEGEGLLGKAKELLGGLTGNPEQQAEGQATQAEGHVQQGVGDVQKGVGDAFGRTGGQEKAAGQGDQLVGQAKEGIGTLSGNRDLQSQGEGQQTGGQAKEGIGGLKEGIEHLTGNDR